MQWPRPSLVEVVLCMVPICMVEATLFRRASVSQCCCVGHVNHSAKAGMEPRSMANGRARSFEVSGQSLLCKTFLATKLQYSSLT